MENQKTAAKPEKKSEKKVFAFCVSLLGLFAVAICLNFALSTWKPLQYLQANDYVPREQNPLAIKIDGFFESKECPDLLIMGSSQPMNAIARSDATFTGTFDESNMRVIRGYKKALYLESLLKEKTGKPVSAYNLALPECMISDADLLLKTAIQTHKTPKTVIFGIYPRDFNDNLVAGPGKTKAAKLIYPHMPYGEIFNSSFNLAESLDHTLAKSVYIYKTGADYLTMAQQISQKILSRPSRVFQPQELLREKKLSAAEIPPPTQYADLPCFKVRFQPVNFARFEQEKNSFESFLRRCRDNNIRAIIVSMPATEQNLALFPADMQKRYRSETQNLASKYGAEFIDMQSNKEFQESDFRDSAHMNSTGGKKWHRVLLSQSKSLTL